MTKIARGIFLFLVTGWLAACGGGGGGGGGNPISGEGGITGPAQIQVSLTSPRVVLPANGLGVEPSLGSPYTVQLTVNVKLADGSPIANGTTVQMTVGNVNSGAVSKLDDPATTENEFTTLFGTLDAETASGRATFFFTSFSTPGTVTLTATVADPNTGRLVSATLNIQVSAAGSGLPSQITIQQPVDFLYIQGVNANDTLTLFITVQDAAGTFVANPASGVNNIQVEIVSGPGGGLVLDGRDAAGNPVQGSLIRTATLAGVATAGMLSGTAQGIASVKVTTDRADNNVDNGLQNPISDEIDIPISDGQLAAISFAPAFSTNANETTVLDGVTLLPDGTYSRIVSVVASDSLGQPVILGTPIVFGLVDTPTAADSCGSALGITGNDGDPVEGGTAFSAAGGRFLMGGARFGDLLLYRVEGDPLETGGRVIDQVLSNQNLTILVTPTSLSPFNTVFNNLGGRDPGPVAHYVIGRPNKANIESPQFTDQSGIARTVMNYPAIFVNDPVALVAQGLGAQNKTVGTVLETVLQALGPGTLTASPDAIDVSFSCEDSTGSGRCDMVPAGLPQSVVLRLLDEQGIPIPNAAITASITGSAEIISGLLASYCTDANGQVTVNFTIEPCGDAECSLDASIDWGAVGVPAAVATTTITSALTVVEDILTVDPASVDLMVDPGATGSETLTVSGGVPPYTIAVANANGSVNPTMVNTDGGTFVYAYNAAGVAAGTTDTDTITVTDANGLMVTVPVTITVGAGTPLAIEPTALNLMGTAGGAVNDTFSVSGGQPPYMVSVSDALGSTCVSSVNPMMLAAAGDVNYAASLAGAAGGDVCQATVTVTDSAMPAAMATAAVTITVSP